MSAQQRESGSWWMLTSQLTKELSGLQWLHTAYSSRYATAVCLVRQLPRYSACFCSPLWVHERRLFSSVSCSLSSACLLAGRHDVKEKSGCPLVQQAITWPILLAFKCKERIRVNKLIVMVVVLPQRRALPGCAERPF